MVAFDPRYFDSSFYDCPDPFNLEDFKNVLRNTLRLYLYPEDISSSTTLETTLSVISDSNTINVDIAQSFIPFTTLYSTKGQTAYTLPTTLKFKKYGTPDDGITVSIVSDSNDTPSTSTLSTGSISVASISTVTTSVTLDMTFTSMLGSKSKYWIKIEPEQSASTINYFTIFTDDTSNNYWMGVAKTLSPSTVWTSMGKDIYFDCSLPSDWIWGDYPRIELSIYKYPQVAIDFIGRPRVDQRWIDHRLSEYYLTCNIICYSRYKDELDNIISYIDRTIFKERINMGEFKILNPANFTPVSIVRENLFAKSISYSCLYKMYST